MYGPKGVGGLYVRRRPRVRLEAQVILPTAPGVSNEGRSSPLLGLVPPFFGPGFRLGACWNRLVEAVKTRKKREKTGKKWARYGLRSVKEEGRGGITWVSAAAVRRPLLLASALSFASTAS